MIFAALDAHAGEWVDRFDRGPQVAFGDIPAVANRRLLEGTAATPISPTRMPTRSIAQSSGTRRGFCSNAATAGVAASTSGCWSGRRARRAAGGRLCRCD
jgi:hypothetical protein